MNALRSGSAFARRSLATPPPVAPLSSTPTRLLSSSFTSFSSPQRSLSSASLPRTNRISASTRWSGSTPSLYLTQSRTMASDSKIKVQNPVVELDGDEVWNFLQCNAIAVFPLYIYYSLNFPWVQGAYHKPALPFSFRHNSFSSCVFENAGKYGAIISTHGNVSQRTRGLH
jgi:hypothetical protein